MVRALFAAFCVTFLAAASFIVAPLFASPPVSVVGSAPLNLPKRDHLVELLKSGQHAELDKVLKGLQERYEAGRLHEWYVTSAFNAFERADPDMDEPLKVWRETHPDSFAPHLAIGLYALKQAWAIRGEKIVALTNPEQFKAMKRFLDESKPALWEAVRINPKLPIGWGALVSTAMTVGSRRDVAMVYAAAREEIPDSSLLYRRYHYALSPKWGGSALAQGGLRLWLRWNYSDHRDYLWARYYSDTERVDALLFQGAVHWISRLLQEIGATEIDRLVSYFLPETENVEHSKDSEDHPAVQALRIIDDILPHWETAWLRKRRGDALYRLSRIHEVIPEYARAVELSPYWVEARMGMTRILSLHNRYRDAHEQWKAAVEVDPYDPDLLVDYATFLSGVDEKEEARSQLRKASVYGEHDDEVRVQSGRLYWELGQMEPALAEMKKAAELVPENPHNWYFYGLALKRTKNCDAIDAYKSYLRLCRKWGCGPTYTSVAQTEIKNITAGCD